MVETGAARITYRAGNDLDLDEVIQLYVDSTLGERRPVEDRARMQSMLRHANLVFTAWDGDRLVGIARSLTDYTNVAYLADLAVHCAYQKRGIGRELVRLVQSALHPGASVVLLAAPAAVEYYPRIGMAKHPSAWTILASDALK